MKIRYLTFLVAALMILPSIVSADSNRSITRHIQSTSPCRIIQSHAIELLLSEGGQSESKDETDNAEDDGSRNGSRRSVGYRVQVFSDNNARTAKNEARSMARNISSRFPEQKTYVTYNSPYWRLRIGDFRNQTEANEFADELRKAFPSYAKEVRVVRDRISSN